MSFVYAKICLNGHVQIESQIRAKEFCEKCGAEIITACPNCHTQIKSWYLMDYDELDYLTYEKPFYCRNCGKPYPWTESAIQNASLLIQEEEELSEQLKSSVIQSLPDIITETPATNLAVVRVKKCLASAGKFTAEAIRQFVIDFGCELAIKKLGL